jgi:hypothetical protein
LNILNFTKLAAEAFLVPDKDGYEDVVVVVKGTFQVLPNGQTRLANAQLPLIYEDRFHGDPGLSSVHYESDLAPWKPRCDVIVNGTAHSPGFQPAEWTDVTLEVGPLIKTARVFGDRFWKGGLLGVRFPSAPIPFTNLAVVWERAFGGSDCSDPNPKNHRFEMRNLVGVGLDALGGKPVPNVEDPKKLIGASTDRPVPRGIGYVGRGWSPRIKYGGTYDAHWLEKRFPFLPEDFDERYYQGAPEDQQIPHLQGGESVRLVNFTPEGILEFKLPELHLPISIPFRAGEQSLEPNLDTVVIEPDAPRVLLNWRARTRCRGKPTDIGTIRVGEPSPAWMRARATGKVFVDWKTTFPPVVEGSPR